MVLQEICLLLSILNLIQIPKLNKKKNSQKFLFLVKILLALQQALKDRVH